jgi:hypothetical protein
MKLCASIGSWRSDKNRGLNRTSISIRRSASMQRPISKRISFKLIVNAFVGKSMENVRKRRKVNLMSDAVKLKKLLAKQQLVQFVILNEEVVMVERIRA